MVESIQRLSPSDDATASQGFYDARIDPELLARTRAAGGWDRWSNITWSDEDRLAVARCRAQAANIRAKSADALASDPERQPILVRLCADAAFDAPDLSFGDVKQGVGQIAYGEDVLQHGLKCEDASLQLRGKLIDRVHFFVSHIYSLLMRLYRVFLPLPSDDVSASDPAARPDGAAAHAGRDDPHAVAAGDALQPDEVQS